MGTQKLQSGYRLRNPRTAGTCTVVGTAGMVYSKVHFLGDSMLIVSPILGIANMNGGPPSLSPDFRELILSSLAVLDHHCWLASKNNVMR